MPSLDITPLTLGKLVMLLLAVALHESAHAWVADLRGDGTARRLGRVTLNPLPHLHPIMSVLLPAVLLFTGAPFIFGAGRPVPVVRENLRTPDRDFALVALVGPATNFLLAVLCSVLLVLFVEPGSDAVWASWLRFGILINLLLMVFNLIPIPPLDGSRLLAYLLPRAVQPTWYRLDVFGFAILIVLLVTGVLQTILGHTYVPFWRWWTDMCGTWM